MDAEAPPQPSKAGPVLAEAPPQTGEAGPKADADAPVQPSKTAPADPVAEPSTGPTRAGDADPPAGKAAALDVDAPRPDQQPTKAAQHDGDAPSQPAKAVQNTDQQPAAPPGADQDSRTSVAGKDAAGDGKAGPVLADADPTLHFPDLWQQGKGASEPAPTHTFVPDKASQGTPAETLVLDVRPSKERMPDEAPAVNSEPAPPGGGTGHDAPSPIVVSGKGNAWGDVLVPFAPEAPGKGVNPHAADPPHGPGDAHEITGIDGQGGHTPSLAHHDLVLL